jgi:hypothetical protein
MFTANYTVHKSYQEELIRQAENYRLVKAAEGSRDFIARIGNALGKVLVKSGQELLTLSKAVR